MTTEKHVFVLPLPPKELSPNASSPWAPAAKWFRINARKRYRRQVWGLAREYFDRHPTAWHILSCPPGRYRLTETYRFADKRKRDVRNLFAAFKAGEDGLVDAHAIPGDDDSVLTHGSPSIERVKTKAEEGVVVVIEEIS